MSKVHDAMRTVTLPDTHARSPADGSSPLTQYAPHQPQRVSVNAWRDPQPLA
jgi:hypothetical protein